MIPSDYLQGEYDLIPCLISDNSLFVSYIKYFHLVMHTIATECQIQYRVNCKSYLRLHTCMVLMHSRHVATSHHPIQMVHKSTCGV